jgi:hypothetical protein
MNIKLINELVALARQLHSSQQGALTDDFQTWTSDDVYHAGIDDGKIQLARELLDDMNIEWRE